MASYTMRIDISGQRFGRLITIKRLIPSGETRNKWLCQCDCGNKCLATTSDLRRGKTKSCGCLKKELDKNRNKRHGMSNTSLHKRWRSIKDRCFNSKSKSFKNYGGRGISMCDEWKNSFESFENWALGNGYQENLTIERIDVDGNYEPKNCCWIPLEEQAKNRRTTRLISFNGETYSIREWSKRLGISESTLYFRLNSGWDIKDAFTIPVGSTQNHKKRKVNI